MSTTGTLKVGDRVVINELSKTPAFIGLGGQVAAIRGTDDDVYVQTDAGLTIVSRMPSVSVGNGKSVREALVNRMKPVFYIFEARDECGVTIVIQWLPRSKKEQFNGPTFNDAFTKFMRAWWPNVIFMMGHEIDQLTKTLCSPENVTNALLSGTDLLR